MTTGTDTHIQALSFGDLEGRLWGAAIDAGEPLLVVGVAGETVTAVGAQDVSWTRDGRGWRLAGDGFDLHMEPGGEDLIEDPAPDPGTTISGVEELCRVRGTVQAGGAPHDIDCVGTRWILDGVDTTSLESLRAVSSWFAADSALAVLALRPARGAGHDSDLVAATLFDPEGWIPVTDPRLSTTYTDAGVPSRANLELWIGDGEDEYPRRAAAEALEEGVAVAGRGLALRVSPLRCHSRGLEGAGVYVIATFT